MRSGTRSQCKLTSASLWCSRSDEVGILDERLRSGSVVEGCWRPEDQPAYCYHSPNGKGPEQWRATGRLTYRDKVTDAAQLTHSIPFHSIHSIHLFHLFIHSSIHPSIHPSIHLFIHSFNSIQFILFVHLFIRYYVGPSTRASRVISLLSRFYGTNWFSLFCVKINDFFCQLTLFKAR